MARVNQVNLLGNLTRDPEMKTLPNTGKAVCEFSLAVSKWNKDETPHFFKVVAWDKTAELCADYLSKGSKVHVAGELSHRTWEDKDGNKRSAVEVVARDVQFLTPKSDQGYDPKQHPNVHTNTTPIDEDIPF